MGTKMGPSYANLFVGYLKRQFFNQYDGPQPDRFTCTSASVIYCITCTLCKKLYIGETRRRLGDRSREHISDVEKDDKDASKTSRAGF